MPRSPFVGRRRGTARGKKEGVRTTTLAPSGPLERLLAERYLGCGIGAGAGAGAYPGAYPGRAQGLAHGLEHGLAHGFAHGFGFWHGLAHGFAHGFGFWQGFGHFWHGFAQGFAQGFGFWHGFAQGLQLLQAASTSPRTATAATENRRRMDDLLTDG